MANERPPQKQTLRVERDASKAHTLKTIKTAKLSMDKGRKLSASQTKLAVDKAKRTKTRGRHVLVDEILSGGPESDKSNLNRILEYTAAAASSAGMATFGTSLLHLGNGDAALQSVLAATLAVMGAGIGYAAMRPRRKTASTHPDAAAERR